MCRSIENEKKVRCRYVRPIQALVINYELAFWVVAKIVVVLISPGGVVVPWAGTKFYMSCRLFLDLLSSVVVMSLCHLSGQVQLFLRLEMFG